MRIRRNAAKLRNLAVEPFASPPSVRAQLQLQPEAAVHLALPRHGPRQLAAPCHKVHQVGELRLGAKGLESRVKGQAKHDQPSLGRGPWRRCGQLG